MTPTQAAVLDRLAGPDCALALEMLEYGPDADDDFLRTVTNTARGPVYLRTLRQALWGKAATKGRPLDVAVAVAAPPEPPPVRPLTCGSPPRLTDGCRPEDKPFAEAVGKRLVEARVKAGLSQCAAARELGCSPKPVCDVEAGRRTPTARLLAKMARLYGVTIDALIFGENRQ